MLILAFCVYEAYPQKGSFKSLILNKCSDTNFDEVQLIYTDSTNKDTVIFTDDTDKINKIMSYLGSLQLVKYKFLRFEGSGESLIVFFGGYKNVLPIWVNDKNCTQVNINGLFKNYKIIGNEINIKYIEDMIK